MMEQLELELAKLPKMEGIILSEITYLPDSIRSVVSKMVQHRSMSLQEMMDVFQIEQADAKKLGKLCVDKGILMMTKPRGETTTAADEVDEQSIYTLRFARNRRPQLVSEIWDVFDDL